VDPAIEKPAPKVGDPNVVPPPETSGARERRSQNERLKLAQAARLFLEEPDAVERRRQIRIKNVVSGF
jgi:hypothetical protein